MPLNNTLATTTPRTAKKRRSEAQRQQTSRLSMTRHDPVGYHDAAFEGMTETVKRERERLRVAETNTEHNMQAIASAQNQVCPPVVQIGEI